MEAYTYEATMKFNGKNYDAPDLAQQYLSGSLTLSDLLNGKLAADDLAKVLQSADTARAQAHAAELDKVKAQAQAAPKAARVKGITAEVSDHRVSNGVDKDGKPSYGKGGVILRGLSGRFPVTLTLAQWYRLLVSDLDDVRSVVRQAARECEGGLKWDERDTPIRPTLTSWIAQPTEPPAPAPTDPTTA